MNNYPPGVTGSEFAIAGPDYEDSVEGICPSCGQSGSLVEQGYRKERWIICGSCDYVEDLEPLECEYDSI